jgi:hypothetical protein
MLECAGLVWWSRLRDGTIQDVLDGSYRKGERKGVSEGGGGACYERDPIAFVETGTAPCSILGGEERAGCMHSETAAIACRSRGRSTASISQISGRKTAGASRRRHRGELVWAVSVTCPGLYPPMVPLKTHNTRHGSNYDGAPCADGDVSQ